jgi:hypothetical protein
MHTQKERRGTKLWTSIAIQKVRRYQNRDDNNSSQNNTF